jgi:peroxiredoxin (alkyl hydroperoxide reductase subunit C)
MNKEIFVSKDSQKIGINEMFPFFSLQGIGEGGVEFFSSEKNLGKWVILFFCPSAFSLTASSEIKDLNTYGEKLKNLNCQTFVISPDSLASQKVWIQSDKNLEGNTIPFLTDSFCVMSKLLGLLDKKNGGILRGVYIVDSEGVLRYFEKSDISVTRSIPELVRKIEAMQALEKIKVR